MMAWLRRTIAAIVLISISCVAFADPPSETGRVIRTEWTNAFTWVDFKTGYRVVIGIDIYDFCDGEPNEVSSFPIQAVELETVEADFPRWIVNGGAYLPVQVFDFLDFSCELWTTFGPVAAGMAEFHVTDNDWFGTVETNDANAWGFTVHGKVTDLSTGELRTLAAKLRLMYNHQRFEGRATVKLN